MPVTRRTTREAQLRLNANAAAKEEEARLARLQKYVEAALQKILHSPIPSDGGFKSSIAKMVHHFIKEENQRRHPNGVGYLDLEPEAIKVLQIEIERKLLGFFANCTMVVEHVGRVTLQVEDLKLANWQSWFPNE